MASNQADILQPNLEIMGIKRLRLNIQSPFDDLTIPHLVVGTRLFDLQQDVLR
jgi:hypothetical protein